MTAIELLYNFHVELNTIYELPALESDEALYWINKAQDRYITIKYNGYSTPTKIAFEQTQKRLDDLQTLVIPNYYIGAVNNKLTLPYNYRHLLRFKVYHTGKCTSSYNPEAITIQGKTYLPVYPKQAQHDDINALVQDPFNNPTLEYPIYTISSNFIYVYMPENTTAVLVGGAIDYLSNPTQLSITPNVKQFSDNIYSDVAQLPDYCYNEIIDIAIKLYLKSIGDSRYNAAANETILAE